MADMALLIEPLIPPFGATPGRCCTTGRRRTTWSRTHWSTGAQHQPLAPAPGEWRCPHLDVHYPTQSGDEPAASDERTRPPPPDRGRGGVRRRTAVGAGRWAAAKRYHGGRISPAGRSAQRTTANLGRRHDLCRDRPRARCADRHRHVSSGACACEAVALYGGGLSVGAAASFTERPMKPIRPIMEEDLHAFVDRALD